MEYKRVWLKYNTEANNHSSDGIINTTRFPSKNILTTKGNSVYLTFTSGIEVFMKKE